MSDMELMLDSKIKYLALARDRAMSTSHAKFFFQSSSEKKETDFESLLYDFQKIVTGSLRTSNSKNEFK